MTPAPTRRDRWFKYWAESELGYVPLAACSLEAQGLFSRLRAHLHTNSEPYGYMEPLAEPDYIDDLAFALRVDRDKLLDILDELKKRKVLLEDDGRLYSPWMVQSEATRVEYATKGRSGGLKRAAQATLQPPLEHPAQAPAQADSTSAWIPAQATAQGSRARARSTSTSTSTSTEGVQGEPELPPHIPTFEEFCAHFMPDCIPEAWLRRQWEWWEDNKAWLTRGGELKDFRRPVRKRWVQDKATWRAESAEGEKPANAAELEALVVSIEGKLRVEKNETERAKLLKQLKELGA